ncbi:MAG TPA: GNAT family N-acetyltransferase [bacterium]|nr:GNAT family N-acetyltransferase [bacterium]
MTAPLVVRDYETADEAQVLGLLNLTLGTGRAFERSTAFFRWKHVENPFGRSLMLLAENQHVVGLRAFLRWQFRASEGVIHAVRAVDTATHPDHQRKGIFSQLTSACLERARSQGVGLVFNTPNRYSLPGYLKLGWTYVGRASVLVRPLRPGRLIKAVLPAREAASPDADEGWDARPSLLETPLANDAALAELLARDDEHLSDGIRTARTPAFLRWRYALVPSLQYGAHWIEDNGLRAAAIFRFTQRRGLRELTLCELLMDTTAHGRRVIKDVLAASGADYAVAHCASGTPHRRALLSLGFVPVPRGPYFTVRPLTSDLAIDPKTFARWRLALGDLEVF